jgi:hypothetical protein
MVASKSMATGQPVSVLFAKQIMRRPVYSQSFDSLPQRSHR